jgi:hypothetical protein
MSTKASKKMTPPGKQRFPIWLPLIIVAGMALIGVALVGSGNSQSAATVKPQVSGAPALQVDKEKVDLGVVPLGQTVNVSFEVTNAGDQPLVFNQAPYIEVVKGCCPPKPTIAQRTLKPGERTTVAVSFMMHGDMGGYHDFRLHLPTNDPGQSDKTVQILSDWQ